MALLGIEEFYFNSIPPSTITKTLVRCVKWNEKTVYLWNVELRSAKIQQLFASLRVPSITRFTLIQLEKFTRSSSIGHAGRFSILLKREVRRRNYREAQGVAGNHGSMWLLPKNSVRNSAFRVPFGTTTVCFNEGILVDVMYIYDDRVLQIGRGNALQHRTHFVEHPVGSHPEYRLDALNFRLKLCHLGCLLTKAAIWQSVLKHVSHW